MRSHNGHQIPSRGVVVLAIRSESSIIIQSIATCLTRVYISVPETSSDIVQSAHQDAWFRAHGVDQIDTIVHLPDQEGKKRTAT